VDAYEAADLSFVEDVLGQVTAAARRSSGEHMSDVNGTGIYSTTIGYSSPVVAIGFPRGEDKTLRECFRALLNSAFAYAVDEAGTTTLGIIEAPSGSPDWSLTDYGDGSIVKAVRLLKSLPSIWEYIVTYQQLYAAAPSVAQRTTDLASEAEESKSGAKTAVVRDLSVRDSYGESRSILWPSLIVSQEEVPTLMSRIIDFFSSVERCWSVECDIVARSQSPGSEVSVTVYKGGSTTEYRLGFNARNCRVFAFQWTDLTAPGARGAELTVWA